MQTTFFIFYVLLLILLLVSVTVFVLRSTSVVLFDKKSSENYDLSSFLSVKGFNSTDIVKVVLNFLIFALIIFHYGKFFTPSLEILRYLPYVVCAFFYVLTFAKEFETKLLRVWLVLAAISLYFSGDVDESIGLSYIDSFASSIVTNNIGLLARSFSFIFLLLAMSRLVLYYRSSKSFNGLLCLVTFLVFFIMTQFNGFSFPGLNQALRTMDNHYLLTLMGLVSVLLKYFSLLIFISLLALVQKRPFRLAK